MDKAEVGIIRSELNTILAKYGEEKGIQFEIGSISYSSTGFTTKLNATTGESKEEADQVNWGKNCWAVGLDRNDFGKHIEYDRDVYKLVGIKPRSTKYPIVVQNVRTGKRYKFTKSMVQRELAL